MSEIDVGYKYAISIAKQNSLNESIIYSLEEEKFYRYTDGFWQMLSHIELMDLIMRKHGDKLSMYTVSKRMQILDNLKTMVYKKLDEFNKTGFLNFDQGEYDPLTDTLHPHMMSNYSTMRMPYEWDSSIELGYKKIEEVCPLWIKTLGEIFEGETDKINILQEFFGYCLTKDTRKEKALLLLGPSRSGKSTILETLGAMLGKHNCSYVTMDFISNPQYTPLLMNKLVNIDSDVNTKAENFESKFKIITSGEELTCNQKFIETFSFTPYCKLAMGANAMARIADHSMAVYNRLILLPCERVFELEERNIGLKDQLKAELFGILKWAVAGLKRLNERGHFEEKDFMKDAIDELREESNPIEVFFKEFIEVDYKLENKIYVEKGILYEKYRQWSLTMNQQYALSAIRFGRAVYQKYSKYTQKDYRLPNGGPRSWNNISFIEGGIKESIKEPKQRNIEWEE